MRHLLACLAILAAFNGSAQSTMPYNPDADDDSYIGASDILGLLPLYGQQFGIDSSLTCDYDGSEFEDFLTSVFDQNIVMDSVLIQYHVIDSGLVYSPGCPDPVWEVVSLERSFVLPLWAFSTNGPYQIYFRLYDSFGTKRFIIDYSSNTGVYQFTIRDEEVSSQGYEVILGSHISYAKTDSLSGTSWTLPFADSYSFSESGLSFSYCANFLSSATYMNILPYWHYAE